MLNFKFSEVLVNKQIINGKFFFCIKNNIIIDKNLNVKFNLENLLKNKLNVNSLHNINNNKIKLIKHLIIKT